MAHSIMSRHQPMDQVKDRATCTSKELAEEVRDMYLERYPPEAYGTVTAIYPVYRGGFAMGEPVKDYVFEGWHGSAG